ncbi:MAG: rane protein [Paenibacillaceae bacterium]|jgi:TRAP-type C4-dicarboxylate transport system permease large subunit|nr:rane protein [Paenibacillaceae bacterium]
MDITLVSVHWLYLVFIVLIIGFMIRRLDTTVLCIGGIFLLGLLATGSVPHSVSGVFGSFIYAIKELLGTILIISIIVGLSRVLTRSGINETMIAPFARLIRSPALAYWVTGILMMVISWFFWPSPAVALIGAVLLPVAIRAGLPALGVAMAMNLFGHGIALSGDFIIQGAPKLTADAAGIPVGDVVAASVPLVLVMGAVTTAVSFWYMRRDMRTGALTMSTGLKADVSAAGSPAASGKSTSLSPGFRLFFAILVPVLFALDVVLMFTMNLQGGDATALVGGTALLLMLLISLAVHRKQGLEEATTYMTDGFLFGFRIFGPVIPIAAFFYLGDSAFFELFGKVLPEGSHGIVNDLGSALASAVPLNPAVGAATLTTVGAITGLDGSGFSGISLAGSIANLFAASIGHGIATLTALGQIAAIWVGGGTLIPWALIPAAAICGVDPFELARRNVKPVVIGLAVTTVFAMFLL